MTTEQIRKAVEVKDFSVKSHGIYVSYLKWNENSEAMECNTIRLSPEESINELNAIGATECKYWHLLYRGYIFSQWEALTLVIRHEYRKSLDTDMNMLEMDKAIEALKNI